MLGKQIQGYAQRIGGSGLWRLATVALILAIGVSVVLLVRVAIDFIIPPSPPAPGETTTPAPPSDSFLFPEGKDLMAYGEILRQNPFGVGSAGSLTPLGTAVGKDREAKPGEPPSGAPFELAGTIVKSGGYHFAVFERGTGKAPGDQILVREGETVPGIGRVKEIGSGSVLVESSGGARTVLLRQIGALESPQARSRSLRGLRKPRTPSRPASRVQSQIKQIGEGTFSLSKESIEAALKNPQQIMTEARMLPYMEDGVQKGFVVREVKRGGIYDGLGLANGDVLLRVNDLALQSPDSALQAFGALQGLDTIRLEIVRQGENRTLVYHID